MAGYDNMADIRLMDHKFSMDDETCKCAQHGEQPITFVCKHITASPRGETVGFVSYRPEGPNDLRDAWCDACDVYLQSKGGYWIEDEIEVPSGIDVLCAECYLHREADAVQVGRRVVHDG